MNLRKFIRESIERMMSENTDGQTVVGAEILTVPPFSMLPDTRKDVDWNNRGDVYLPSVNAIGKTQIFSKDDITGQEPWTHPKSNKTFKFSGYVEQFKNKFGEEPIFSINSNGTVEIMNEPYLQYVNKTSDAISNFGTEGD